MERLEEDNSELPKEYTVPNPYNIPVHNQGSKKNCTSHAFALMMEYHLSDHFRERTLVDVDDLWEKQKMYGTATEEEGDCSDGPFMIATKYGVRFKTDSGKTGCFFLTGVREEKNGITTYKGWKMKMDNPLTKLFRRFKNTEPKDHGPSPLQLEYNQAVHSAYASGFQTLQEAPNLTIEFSDPDLSDALSQEFSELSPLEIQIWNHSIQQAELQRVSEKYAPDFKGGRLGGIGAPTPEAYIDLAKFAVGFLFKWGLDHIINDLDSKIWETVKTKILNIYKKIKKQSGEKVAFVTSSQIFRHEEPTILFILPSDLSEAKLEKCLTFIATKTSEITSSASRSRDGQKNNFYQFNYDQERNQWNVTEKRTSNLI